jgi:hypothetical protein
LAISLQKCETSFWKSKTLLNFKTKTVLESPNLVDYKTNNAKPEIQKIILIRGPTPRWVPKSGPFGRHWIFCQWKCLAKKILWNIFIRSPKKNTLRFANFLDPNLGVGGPIVWTPCLDVKEGSIFEVKNMSYFEDLWGQKLIFQGQIICIGPHEPLGP